MLISDKTDIKPKLFRRDKGYIYELNLGAPNFIRQTLLDLKAHY
jgi:hypothetical protein